MRRAPDTALLTVTTYWRKTAN